MIQIFFIAWLCAFTLAASAAFGVSMLGCMLRLGNSDLWIAWRSAFVTAARSTLPIALFYMPIVFGMHILYPWATDTEFTNQRWFLNTPFAIVRSLVYFAALIVASRLALAERRNALPKTAAALLIIFFTAHFAAVDWLMALDAEMAFVGVRSALDRGTACSPVRADRVAGEREPIPEPVRALCAVASMARIFCSRSISAGYTLCLSITSPRGAAIFRMKRAGMSRASPADGGKRSSPSSLVMFCSAQFC